MKRVITIGAAVVDAILKSNSLKVVKGHDMPGGVAMCEMIGGKLEAQDGVLATGGGGTNVGVGLMMLGHAVKVLVKVGDDNLAKMIEDELRSLGLDLSLVIRSQGRTGLSAVLVAPDGGRSIITYRGESGDIEPEEILWKDLERSDWLQISSLGGKVSLLEDIVSYANSKNVGVGINPGRGELNERERIIKLLPKVQYLVVNRMEAANLFDIDFNDEDSIARAAASCGAGVVAITDGKRGAGIVAAKKWIRMKAYPNKSVDDTGAGDAFVAGSLSGLLNGESVDIALKMGLANGGSAVTEIGAKSGLLGKLEIQKWLKKDLREVEVEFN